MKKVLCSLFVLCFFGTTYAQLEMISADKVEIIKSTKLVIGVTDDAEANKILEEAVKEFWTFSEIKDTMNASSAISASKSDLSYTVMKVNYVRSKSLSHDDPGSANTRYRYVSGAYTIELYNKKKMIYRQYIPSYGSERVVTKEILAFGISAMNCNLKIMDANKFGVGGLRSYYNSEKNELTPKLKEKTLLIPRGWLDDKTTMENIGETYTGPVKIVSYDEYKEAILTKKEGFAYVSIANVPLGGQYVFQHYIMDASNGDILAIIQPKVSVSMNVSKGNQVNLSKGNAGYVNGKALSNYQKVQEQGKW